jgi:hypothetical protein
MAEADRIKNCNKACLGAGVNTITSLVQNSAEARFCKEWYELLVEAELTLYKWKFATKHENIRANLLAEIPENQFNTAYLAPVDVLSVDTVMVNGRPIRYSREGNQIHTNDTSGDEVVIKYRYRADESLWLPYFKLLVIYRLATMLSFSIARKDDIAASMKALADQHWKLSKTEDAQGQTNQKVNLTKIKAARSGRLHKFWRDR